MAYELTEGSGAIFKNDKLGNDQKPDYSGDAMINGKIIRIALWVKEGKNGKFFSVRAENKRDTTKSNETRSSAGGNDKDKDLPF